MRRALAAAAVALLSPVSPALAREQAPGVALLEVPYVAQRVELCGGAALAMVLRYWGETGVYAETFADLVDPDAGGIRTDALATAAGGRGWQTHAASGNGALLRRSLELRHPPIALIEDRPGRFHYVVVLAWANGRVVLHDPARAPFRVMDERQFTGAWDRSGRWMLVVRPGEDVSVRAPEVPAGAGAAVVAYGGPCGDPIAQAIARVDSGRIGDARLLLERAVAACPAEAAAWRELAGIRALQKDWQGAAADARRALALEAGDAHAARILATSLFLEGDRLGALAAWNLAGEPTLDLVEIRGLERTRFAAAAGALGLSPPRSLTPETLRRAGRRLGALPAAMGSRVTYTPREGGLATVTASVVEHPLLPTSRVHLAVAGVRAASDRELRVQVASPTGGGEVWFMSWRWWEPRPGWAAGLAAPAAFGGVWRLEAIAEGETFGSPGTEFRQDRRRVELGLADWATGSLRWGAAAAVDRWEAGTAAGAHGSLDYRPGDERVRAGVTGGVWFGQVRAWTMEMAVEWRSRREHERQVWLAGAGWSGAGRHAPAAVWPGAGTGQGRRQLLRAHPLLQEGVVRGGAFGRQLVHAGGEWRYWTRGPVPAIRLAPAVFVDVARALEVPAYADGRTHVDAGIGLRIPLAGIGVFRADLARGLRDGEMALSVGWSR